jgi:hypothetical protein
MSLTPNITGSEVIGINPNIADASLFIDIALTAWDQIPESSKNIPSLTQTNVDLIGAYLAAHFGAITIPDAKQEEILKSDIRINYHLAALGQGYNSTRYGQTANLLLGGNLELIGVSSGQTVFSP